MTRMRSPAQRAPQTQAEAAELAGRYAALDAAAAAIEADRQRLLAAVNDDADAGLAPLVAEMKDIVKRLKPWFAGNFDELTKGERKSIELGGCQIGYRVNPPKVVFDGTEEAALRALRLAGLDTLIREKPSLDKPAILTTLEGEDADSVTALGFAIERKEVFFVDRVQPKPETVGDVADGDAGVVS